MKTYKLARSWLIYGLFSIGFMVLIAAILPVLLIKALGLLPGALCAIPYLGILGGNLYAMLRIPFEITVQGNNSTEFRSALKRIVLSPYDIKSIKAGFWTSGFVKIKHTGGTLRLVPQIDGFHEFIWTLRSINPTIEVKGC